MNTTFQIFQTLRKHHLSGAQFTKTVQAWYGNIYEIRIYSLDKSDKRVKRYLERYNNDCTDVQCETVCYCVDSENTAFEAYRKALTSTPYNYEVHDNNCALVGFITFHNKNGEALKMKYKGNQVYETLLERVTKVVQSVASVQQ